MKTVKQNDTCIANTRLFNNRNSVSMSLPLLFALPHLHSFSPQDEEVLGSHHHEAHELVTQDLLDLISLQWTS